MRHSMYLLVAIFPLRSGKGAPGFSYGDTLRVFVVDAYINIVCANNAGSGSGPTEMCFSGGRDPPVKASGTLYEALYERL